MSKADHEYKRLVNAILSNGEWKTSRGGKISPTLDLFGPQLRFDLRDGFPLLTTKKIKWSNIVHELLWILRGETNIKTLKAPKIWAPWADEDGECKNIYGKQWRRWVIKESDHRVISFDQIERLLFQLKTVPDSRRLIVSAWNAPVVDDMALPPCHMAFQLNVAPMESPINGKQAYLDLKLYQRSADTAIGVPYNIASYALLLTMLANEVNMIPRHFIHSFGSAHIYEPHIATLKEQILRAPTSSPVLSIKRKPFWDLVYDDNADDFDIIGYQPHPAVTYKVEV